MNFTYDTERLTLKILDGSYARAVLDFYLRNRELFEKNEPPRQEGFYTCQHQKAILTAEYNMAVHGTQFRFWIFRKDTPELIGTVSFRSITRMYYQSCKLGYKLGREHWGQGYMTEALREGVRIAFDDLKLHRITSEVMPENDRSIRLMERLGFVNEGIERKVYFINGSWEDHILFSLISSEAHSFDPESAPPFLPGKAP